MKTYKDIVKVACVNFLPIVADKAATLRKIENFIIQLSGNGANIIVFPETALTGYAFPKEMASELSETIPGPSTERVAKLAAKCHVYVVLGMVERDKNHANIFYNSAAVVGPNRVLGAYQKVHPAPPEAQWCHAGRNYPIFETEYGRIGVGICRDVHDFPEVARIYAIGGVRLLIHPDAFPEFPDNEARDYQDFYLTTLGARSIENQMFIANADLVGVEGEFKFFGHSVILGPKPGSMNYHLWAGPAGTDEEVVEATLDLHSLKYMSVHVSTILQDRRPDTYSQLTSNVKPDR